MCGLCTSASRCRNLLCTSASRCRNLLCTSAWRCRNLIWNYPLLRVEPIVHSFERSGIVIFFLPTLKFLFHFQHAVVTAVSSSDDNWVVIHWYILPFRYWPIDSFNIPFNHFIQMGWPWCLAQLTLPITFIQAGTDLGSQQFSFSFWRAGTGLGQPTT